MSVDKNKISAEATRLLQKGQLDKAIKAYQRILEGDPADSRALLKIAEIQQKKGDVAAAAETFTRVAEAYGTQGFFLKAVAVYKQVQKLAPDDVRVSDRLAQLYQQLGLVSEAMSQLHAIVRLAEKSGDDDKLLEALRRVVEIDPDHVQCSVKLGELYVKLEQPSLALEHLRRAAEQLKRNNRVDEYAKVAERIAALVPDDHDLAREVAAALMSRGDARRALQKLLPCYRADPAQLETLTLLARVFHDLGQETKLAAVYREIARLHGNQGRPGDAHLAWKKVAELEPDDPEAAEALAADQAVDGNAGHSGSEAARSVPATAAARSAGGPTPVARIELGAAAAPDGIAKVLAEADVYVKYGLHEKALEHLQKIFAGEPDHVDAREKASRIRELRNDLAGAADEQARAIDGARARGLSARAEAGLERLRQLSPAHPAIIGPAAAGQGAGADVADGEEGIVLEVDELTDDDARERGLDDVGGAVEASAERPSDEVAAAVDDGCLGPEGNEPDAELVESTEVGPDDLALSAALVDGDVVDDDAFTADAERRVSDVIVAPADPAFEAAEAVPEPAPIEEATGPGESAAPPGGDVDAELAEAEFFLSQGLLDEAEEVLEVLRALHPSHPGIAARIAELQAAKVSPAKVPSAPAKAPPAPAPDYLFSVRDVLEPFKKGIEQTITPSDSQTHYDLGIAYKEMGLFGDAAHEFEVALGGALGDRRFDCLMLLGLCHLDGGDPARAIEAYRTALDAGATGDLRHALEAELARALEVVGEPDAAPAAASGPADPVTGTTASVRRGR